MVVIPHHPPCSCLCLGALQPQEALNSEGQYLHEAFKDVAKELQANHVSTVSLFQGVAPGVINTHTHTHTHTHCNTQHPTHPQAFGETRDAEFAAAVGR